MLELSESAYYARKKRPKPARRLRDEQLMPLIEDIHTESGGTYGVRRISRALRRKGVAVARGTVERLMRELGLEGVIRGQRRRTTVPEPSALRPPGPTGAPNRPRRRTVFPRGWPQQLRTPVEALQRNTAATEAASARTCRSRTQRTRSGRCTQTWLPPPWRTPGTGARTPIWRRPAPHQPRVDSM
ncbi:IS3 family transposase [Streptomyces sp. NPDC020845]|uniref:IS3 family transposase n=1 Tax=Streptomyces sp. NPDC020845 TaxID=3365096 RepID=UPI0037AF377C